MKPEGIESPEVQLAEGFAQHAERWALARGAAEGIARAVRTAARAVSVATSNGQVCVTLHELESSGGEPGDSATWRVALLASGVVGTPDART